MTDSFPIDNDLQCAWDDYIDAKDHADRTRNLNDGITAGRMWRRFVYKFADPERVAEDNNVVRLPSARTGEKKERYNG